ncbi:hypothetical protein B0A54_16230 [Friedmanniomyces endolithicus]|uniref:Mid2 domain-containing protein n=1 Tax=Friedmanniomyces endolithicus TaxID=329885 RepID=A0A4U0U160_9PEZI|nr:hypothetical protein LTS09_015458 [Friedmanniomyces endolithicus]TKA28548.1 hypothetical protein B0A54_16230 [Friedmanniomyces endolithicus]
MAFLQLLTHIALFLSIALAYPPLGPDVHVRSSPELSVEDVVLAVQRDLAIASLTKRQELNVATSLERSWNGAVLLKLGEEQDTTSGLNFSESVMIVCTECYTRGYASGQLIYPANFTLDNINQTLHTVEIYAQQDVKDLESYAKTYFEQVVKKVESEVSNISDWGTAIDNFALPTFNHSLTDLEFPHFSGVTLHFEFDEVEVFMLMDATLGLGATYTHNLYTSDTEAGIGFGGSELGIVFKLDIILAAEGAIDISTGFHLKLQNGLAIDITLFGTEVSHITYNGGQFEFLPITVVSGDVVFTAILRMGIHAGIELDPSTKYGAGVEVAVYANIAEFTTNLTYQQDKPNCDFGAALSYQFALGANVGATAHVGSHTWGGSPNTSTAIWYTGISTCADAKRTAPATASMTESTAQDIATATPGPLRRQALTLTTLTTLLTYTGVSCMSTGLMVCPASLQTSTRAVSTSTFITAVESGMAAVFPLTSQDLVTSLQSFGSNAATFSGSKGSPVSYVPPTSTGLLAPIASTVVNIENAAKKLDRNIGLGIGIGLGFPVLLLIGFLVAVCLIRRHRYTGVERIESPEMPRYDPYENSGVDLTGLKVPEISAMEVELMDR